jgi:hypothetical protein
VTPTTAIVVADLDRMADAADDPYDKGCLRGAADYIAALEGRIAGLLALLEANPS